MDLMTIKSLKLDRHILMNKGSGNNRGIQLLSLYLNAHPLIPLEKILSDEEAL